MLENVRALSSLHRLSAAPELDDEMVGRLVQRAPAEARDALRPYGYYEPEVTTELTEKEGRWHAVVKIVPGAPVQLVDQAVEVTGPGRDEPFMKRALERSALRTGEQLSHPAYEQLKGDLLRAALGRGYLDAEFTTSELVVDPAARTARARISLATGERYRFGADDDRAERGSRQPGEPVPSLPGGRLVQRRGAAAHAVRARRLAVLLARGSAARGTRPAGAHRADPHHLGAEPAAPLHDCRGLRHGHRRARDARLGRPAPQRPGPPAARPGADVRRRGLGGPHLHHPVEGPGAREALLRAQGLHRAERGRRDDRRNVHGRPDPGPRSLAARAFGHSRLDRGQGHDRQRRFRAGGPQEQPVARPRHHVRAAAAGFPRHQRLADRLSRRGAGVHERSSGRTRTSRASTCGTTAASG